MTAVQVGFRCCACAATTHVPFLTGVPDRLGVTKTKHDYVRCASCGLVALHPRPTFEETASFYPQSFWRTNATAEPRSLAKRVEARIRDRLVRADFALIESHFRPGVRHLDVGCATGDFMRLCQSRGSKSTGIELSEAAVRYCAGIGLSVIQGDLVEHDFHGQTFEVITYNGVLEHVPDPYAHLVKCRSLLEPRGKLVILGIPNIDSVGFRFAKKRWIGLDTPRHIHQFSSSSLRALLEKAAFTVKSVESRSPRFNPPSLVASVLPGLHRHAFDAYEARTGKNPVLKKAVLAALLQMIRPVDWALSNAGLGEHLTATAEPA